MLVPRWFCKAGKCSIHCCVTCVSYVLHIVCIVKQREYYGQRYYVVLPEHVKPCEQAFEEVSSEEESSSEGESEAQGEHVQKAKRSAGKKVDPSKMAKVHDVVCVRLRALYVHMRVLTLCMHVCVHACI